MTRNIDVADGKEDIATPDVEPHKEDLDFEGFMGDLDFEGFMGL